MNSRRSPYFLSRNSRTTSAGASRLQTGPLRDEKQVYSVKASQPRATTTPPLASYVEIRSSRQFKSVVARALATAPTVGNREHPESQAPSNSTVFTVKNQQPTCQREFASNSPLAARATCFASPALRVGTSRVPRPNAALRLHCWRERTMCCFGFSSNLRHGQPSRVAHAGGDPYVCSARRPAACRRRLTRGNTASRLAIPRGRCHVE
jgi:hypothetical protein